MEPREILSMTVDEVQSELNLQLKSDPIDGRMRRKRRKKGHKKRQKRLRRIQRASRRKNR